MTEEIIQDKDDILEEYFDTGESAPEENTPVEEQEAQEPQEPIIIETKGKWVKFEEITNTSFEVGKVYNINVGGNCQFMISKHKPANGLITNNITYTKDNENFLWIKTR